jgi:KUP system potassium uptake protein
MGRAKTASGHRNALAATDFFRIPPNRVIELGRQTEI